MPLSRRLWTALVVVVSLAALLLVAFGLHLDPDVAGLLPQRGEAAALRRYLSAFGGSDLSLVLIEASSEPQVEEAAMAAHELAVALEKRPEVRWARDAMPVSGSLDPWLVWRHADEAARAALAEALSDEGMRRRLRGSRDLLLSPGSSGVSERLAEDPLRLAQLVTERRAVGGGFATRADGTFASEDGLYRLVLVLPEGGALRGADARAFVTAAQEVLAEQRAAHPSLRYGLTGGHAIGAATEAMLQTDLKLSSTASLLLAALAFGLTFRRLRALLAVMPPLLLGSLWTAALASLMPGGLSAIAVAFMSVVIGVGVDTGVHVYAALLEARQAGVPPDEAAAVARAETQRPVLVAAATAAVAFAALALSDIAALRQLGILCAAGELLTAVAIVIITPEIGAWLERKPPPAPSPARWTGPLVALTRGRGRAAICVILLAAPAVAVAFGYAPRISSAIVALRPKGLAPLEVQERIDKAFGGRPGQWVLMVADTDEASARRRTDRLYEALLAEPEHLDAIDSISTLAPAPDTQRERLAERDALDLPARATALEAALTEVGFAASRFEPVLAAMRAPPHDVFDRGDLKESGYMLERYLGQDAGEVLVVTYLLPKPGFEAEVEATVARVDPAAVLTGYRRLDKTLRESLTTELPRIALLAAALVIGALAFALRRIRDVAIAITVVALEIGMVLALVRALDVPLHIYDALVLPVLLGITVDEAMFLLHRARTVGDDPSFIDMTLRYEGPPVATTALTTAAGFAGLLLCDFDGLRHLGAMGAIGSVAGLVVALVVVPAGLRVARG